MRVLVTGAAGFTGRHLVEALRARGDEVWATARTDPGDIEGARFAELDVADADQCRRVLEEVKPEQVFHLAASTLVVDSQADPDVSIRVNFLGTRHLLEPCLDLEPRPRVLIASSAQVYGKVQPDDIPIHERVPLRPASIYAVTKGAAELLASHAAARGLHVVVARAFNHVGPGLPDRFVASAFAKQVAEIEAGLAEPVLRVGNLEAERDFVDVGDVCRAYLALIEKGRAGEVYDVSSGAGQRVRALLDTLLELSKVEVKVEVDPDRLRPIDMPRFHGSGDKLAEETGLRIPFDVKGSLERLLDYWRDAVASGRER